jgi:hypothetical protein
MSYKSKSPSKKFLMPNMSTRYNGILYNQDFFEKAKKSPVKKMASSKKPSSSSLLNQT